MNPPALGAFILANLKAFKGDPPQLRPVIPSQPHLSSVLTAYQPFNLNLPLIFPENEDLIMDNARQAAAAGFIRPESIPLLALTDESFYHRKLSWTLRFPVPPPDTSGSVRRFSSTVTFRQGPHSAEALEGALRLAASFSYNNDASHVLFNSPFLRLPDLSVLRPPRIDSFENPSPPEHAVREWLNNRAPRLIPSRYREYHPVPLGLVDYFNSNIHLPQVGFLIETHQCNNEDATAEARRHKRDFAPTAFLRIIPAGTVMSGNRLPDLPSAGPTPETLPRTALAPSPSILAPRPAPPSAPSAQPSHSSQSASTRPQHPPPPLLYLHLLPTPPLLALHRFSLLTSFTLHHLACCQPGHTVRFAACLAFPFMSVCPFEFAMVLSLPPSSSSLFSLSSTPFLLLGSSTPLFSSHFHLWFRPVPLHLTCFFFDLSLPPFCGQPGHTVRLATSCYSLPFLISLLLLYFPSLLLFFFLSFLSFLPHLSPASSSPLKVFAQSGSAQRGNTLSNHDPQWSLAAMSGAFRAGAAYDLQLPSCAFPMCRLRSWCQLCCWMPRPTIYSTTLSLGILLTLKVKLDIQPSYNCIQFATIYSSLFGFSP